MTVIEDNWAADSE
jgi:hypothetical protein